MFHSDDAKRAAEITACKHQLVQGKRGYECAKCGVALKAGDPGYADLLVEFLERTTLQKPSDPEMAKVFSEFLEKTRADLRKLEREK